MFRWSTPASSAADDEPSAAQSSESSPVLDAIKEGVKKIRGRNPTYKESTTLEQRKAESERVIKAHPGKVPAIVERSRSGSFDIPELSKRKFVMSDDKTIASVMHVIRQNLKLEPHQAIFLFAGAQNTLLSNSTLIAEAYHQLKDPEDNFLYITYSGENVFG